MTSERAIYNLILGLMIDGIILWDHGQFNINSKLH